MGSWAIMAQTEVKSCSLPHQKIVDADDNSSGQFVDGHDLGTVGSLQLKRFADFSLSLSGILLLNPVIFFSAPHDTLG